MYDLSDTETEVSMSFVEKSLYEKIVSTMPVIEKIRGGEGFTYANQDEGYYLQARSMPNKGGDVLSISMDGGDKWLTFNLDKKKKRAQALGGIDNEGLSALIDECKSKGYSVEGFPGRGGRGGRSQM